MKKNFVRLIAQVAIVSVLFVIGLIAICGEPAQDANFIATVACQLLVAVACISIATALSKKWQIARKMNYTGLFQ